MFDKVEDKIGLYDPFTLMWSVKDIGFGQFHFYERDGRIYCDNEAMSKEFIKKVLCTMVDQCELTDNDI